MATRDRYGGFGEPASTPLQRYIRNACNPQNFEPNLALNLEISDMINAKKGNAPREAAMAIVSYVNDRNPNISLLALNLLDICVKNCGYPFHLQISTKEFLNELVRRFPERPPIRYTRVQNKILGLIEEWRSTICQTSRYKEDLGFIRDMHRLLSFKGYVFPEVKMEDAAVLNPSDNLRSAEEMEEEEREAQSAKLQELIRRGGPQDLQEANRLMKVMAGYDTRNKTDWRAKAAEEVARVQQKAKLLEDMLQRHKAGDKLQEGDVFEELANALMSAHPKIQKMCEEESDDHEAVAKLLEINDSINRTIERYRLVKKGDVEGAAKIPKGTLGISGAGVSKGPNNELSLIDLGDEDDHGSSQEPAPKGGSTLADDLLGLSLDPELPTTGEISLGGSNGFETSSSNASHLSNAQITSLFQHSQHSGRPQSIGAAPPAYSSPLQAPQPVPQPAPRLDPFASIAKPESSRQASPFQYQQSIQPVSVLAAKPAQNPRTADLVATTADDEWDFASALPVSAAPTSVLMSAPLQISWSYSRPPGHKDVIEIKSSISNGTSSPVSDVTMQVAASKSFTLKLEPQSSLTLAPNQKDGITQTMRVLGVSLGQGKAVRMKWKLAYTIAGQARREEMGGIDGLPGEL